MIVDQLTPLLPKDSVEVNAQVKRLQAMLDVATMVDPTLDRVDRRGGGGKDPSHHQSPHEDLANSITPPVERGQDQDGDLHNVIRNRDAHDQIENRLQERDRVECERCNERDYDYYDPYYDQPHHHRSPAGGCNEGGSSLSLTN
jgi:hypothetical protein